MGMIVTVLSVGMRKVYAIVLCLSLSLNINIIGLPKIPPSLKMCINPNITPEIIKLWWEEWEKPIYTTVPIKRNRNKPSKYFRH